jgi:hypothetical protein
MFDVGYPPNTPPPDRYGGFTFYSRASIRPAPRNPDSDLPAPDYILSTCGRATYKLTWEEIVALYQLTLFQPA